MARDDLAGKDAGHYRLGEVLHRGETSVVYQAEHTSSGQRVVVKVFAAELPPPAKEKGGDKAVQKLIATVERATAVKHPHLCEVLDVGLLEHHGKRHLYIAMERLQGKPLSQQLQALGGRPLPLAQALQIVSDVGAALQAVHREGGAHGSLDIGSVFICEPVDLDGEETARLLGLGTAQARAGLGEAQAPNQKGDIRDLGRLLQQLLGGASKPDQAPAPVLALRQHNREVPVHVTSALRTALGEAPASEAFPSVAAFVAALLGTGDMAPSVGAWSSDGSSIPLMTGGRSGLSIGWVVGVMLMVGGGIGMYWHYFREQPGLGPVATDLSSPPVQAPDQASLADLAQAPGAPVADQAAPAPADLAVARPDLATAPQVARPTKHWPKRPGPPIPPLRVPEGPATPEQPAAKVVPQPAAKVPVKHWPKRTGPPIPPVRGPEATAVVPRPAPKPATPAPKPAAAPAPETTPEAPQNPSPPESNEAGPGRRRPRSAAVIDTWKTQTGAARDVAAAAVEKLRTFEVIA